MAQLNKEQVNELLGDIIDMYALTYNLFQTTRLEDFIVFFRPRYRLDILAKRRQLLLHKQKKIIDKLSGSDTILPVDDLPLGVYSLKQIREVVGYNPLPKRREDHE